MLNQTFKPILCSGFQRFELRLTDMSIQDKKEIY